MPRYTPPAERFALNSVRDGECVRWTGHRTREGYGLISVHNKRHQVHRLAYELARGPIPDGLEIDHLCSVRDCINPEHLEAVTHHENLLRMFRKMRPDGYCTEGHLIAGDNAKSAPQGRGVRCRTCFNAKRRRWRADRAAAGRPVDSGSWAKRKQRAEEANHAA